METWLFVVAMAEHYLLLVAIILILAYAAHVWVIRRSRRAEPTHDGKLKRALVEPALVFVSAIIVYRAYRLSMQSIKFDVAVGDLKLANLVNGRLSWRSVDTLCIPSIIAWVFMSKWAHEKKSEPPGLTLVYRTRRVARWAWWAVAFHIPMAYGLTHHGATYPAARVEDVCGLLVAASSDSFTLWNVHAGRGRTQVLPSKEKRMVVFGLHDLLTEATGAIERKSDVPNCD